MAAIFFTLFAFALNNQEAVAVNFFFGTVWKAPLVLVVLIAFATGLGIGVFLMMPRWWKKRRALHSTYANTSIMSSENPSTERHGI